MHLSVIWNVLMQIDPGLLIKILVKLIDYYHHITIIISPALSHHIPVAITVTPIDTQLSLQLLFSSLI